MRSHADKERFLTTLSEIPLISVACRQTGIAKATIYRWRENDKKFARRLDEAQKQGRGVVNDLAEGQLITLIKKGSLPATRFWLESNDPRYYRPRRMLDEFEKGYKGVTEFNLILNGEKTRLEQNIPEKKDDPKT